MAPNTTFLALSTEAHTDIQNVTTSPLFNNATTLSQNCSRGTYEFAEFWIDGILTSFIAAVGFALNSFAIYILLTRKNMQNMFNHLLVCSFVTDNVFLFTSAFPRLYYNFHVNFVVWMIPHFAYPFEEIAYTMNILLTVCLSHERYIIIPNQTQYRVDMAIRRNRMHRLMVYILPITILSVAYNIPKFFAYYLDETSGEVKKRKTDLKKSDEFKIYYLCWSWFAIVGVCFLIIVALNTIIVWNLKKNFSAMPENRQENVGG